MVDEDLSEEEERAMLEAGATTAEVCRRHGISSATFYAWKSKYGGMEVSDAKRLKAVEEENAKLKQHPRPDAMLDNVALKDLLALAPRAAPARPAPHPPPAVSCSSQSSCVVLPRRPEPSPSHSSGVR